MVVSPLQWWLFSHYNGILKEPQTSASAEARTKVTPKALLDANQEMTSLSKQYAAVALSDDEKTIAYVDSSQNVHLKSLVNGQDTTLVQMKAPVVYLKWIRNDSVFVGEKFSVSGVPHLTLATVDVQTKDPRVIKTFSGLSSTTTFEKIAFSHFTNNVYVLLGSKFSSLLYHFDTNGTPTVLSMDGRLVQNVDVGQTNGDLFFQDFAEGTKNVLLYENNTPHLIQRNCVILGVVDNDLYYGALDSNGFVDEVFVYPTTSPSAASSGGSTNTTSSNQSTTPDNGPPSLVKTLSTPVEPSRISITNDKQIVITPS